MRIGDTVRSRLQETLKVIGLEATQTEALVYNFLVDDLHCYAVGQNEVLVHNTSAPEIEKMKPGKGAWDEGGGGYDMLKRDGQYKLDLGKAREAYDTNSEFHKFLHKEKKGSKGGGNKHNYDLDDDTLVRIYRKWQRLE